MPPQARKIDLDNPDRALVCVDLNGVLDRYTGWKHADRFTGDFDVSIDKHWPSPTIQPAWPIVV